MKYLLILLLPIFIYAETLSEYGYNLELIANHSKVEVTIEELQFIYTGKIRLWEDGERMTLFIRSLDNRCQRTFVLNMLGMSMSRFQETVNRYSHIKTIDSSSIIPRMVRNVGSIGIVSDSQVYLSTAKGLVVLEVVEE